MDQTNIEAQLNRLLAGQTFARASRHQRFLRYVVELSAQGRSEELKEFTIAVEVFDQPQSYDPQIDSIVRSEASRLRNRLEKYYKTEGLSDSIRIEIPKGSYAAVFHEIAPAAEAQDYRAAKPAATILDCGRGLAAVVLTAFAAVAFAAGNASPCRGTIHCGAPVRGSEPAGRLGVPGGRTR